MTWFRMTRPKLIYWLVGILLVVGVRCDDYYDLLGVERSADPVDIRKAFKRLALKMHPDKNTDDPDATAKFVAINRAYEVLKSEETRKKYDLFGEDGLNDDHFGHGNHNFHSWTYYSESFGIYDDDPEIVTLSSSDFEQLVRDSPFVWFVNFYSPQCSHCHDLAPAWRQLARQLEDVIRIGAVNCEDDFWICRQEAIQSYPSLVFYPDKEKYHGNRDVDYMVDYVLQKLPNRIVSIDDDNIERVVRRGAATSRWLMFFCNSNDCQFSDTARKVSIMLEGLVNVGQINCHVDSRKVCESFDVEMGIRFFADVSRVTSYVEIQSTDEAKDVVARVMDKLPNGRDIEAAEFELIVNSLKDDEAAAPWVMYFHNGKADDRLGRDLKRLPALLSGISFGQVNCKKDSSICSSYFISTYPKFIVFNTGGSYEFYHGGVSSHDIATFAKESISSRIHTLKPDEFIGKVASKDTSSDEAWFVDFFAPWCPPCMKLLPEVRKASRVVGHLVKFGTIDCTLHRTLCQKYNIQSYPTVMLYNHSVVHQFHGSHSTADLVEFVYDMLSPPVTTLTSSTFEDLVTDRSVDSIYLVEFFAPWCGPCQKFAPQWRKVAKMFKDDKAIQVGQVDCTAEKDLCSREGVTSYPTIRMYPSRKSDNEAEYLKFDGYNRDAASIRIWVHSNMPSSVRELNMEDFDKLLLSKNIWLVDYYAPWCGHCNVFAPEFESVSKSLKGQVKCAKVNCQDVPELCRQAGIRAYPTVKLYLGQTAGQPQDPQGVDIDGFSYQSVMAIVGQHLSSKEKISSKDEL